MTSLIIESSLFAEADVVKQTQNKAIFRCPIQTFDEINSNKRKYPKDVLEESFRNCEDRMRKRAFYSELDHPLPTGNAQVDGIRQTTVLFKEASHIIRDYEFGPNNTIMAEMETLSTHNGKDLLALLRDKTGVGFSMRGLGELVRMEAFNLVKGPLQIVAYDAVSMPSHKSAVVNFGDMRFEQTALMECQNGVVCVGNQCFMPNYFDKLIENKMIEFHNSWV
jgi:hypothetical protein